MLVNNAKYTRITLKKISIFDVINDPSERASEGLNLTACVTLKRYKKSTHPVKQGWHYGATWGVTAAQNLNNTTSAAQYKNRKHLMAPGTFAEGNLSSK